MLSIDGLLHRWTHFDPGLGELRKAAAVMAAVLAAYGSALLVENLAALHLEVVILAVVLALTTARGQRTASLGDRLFGLAVLLAATLAAAGIGGLLSAHPDAGDTLFVAGVSASIWIRRFGQRATRAGSLIMAPLVAVLVTPSVPPGPGTLWVVVVAVLTWFWVTVVQLLAVRTGFVPPQRETPAPAASPARQRRPRL